MTPELRVRNQVVDADRGEFPWDGVCTQGLGPQGAWTVRRWLNRVREAVEADDIAARRYWIRQIRRFCEERSREGLGRVGEGADTGVGESV